MGPYELLQKIVGIFEHLHVPYLVTGSVAAMAYEAPSGYYRDSQDQRRRSR